MFTYKLYKFFIKHYVIKYNIFMYSVIKIICFIRYYNIQIYLHSIYIVLYVIICISVRRVII